ncbi:DUF962 domain-containing protein [Trinickia fusca]|uniref:DUF962 domain-containing protein n=1 Tax=Trinickia fusca TaxID=2419777 RepID=A0A494XC72_9BURK|nr:Mpo1-like protein [Trinickia fusca]RKP48355.1 DUF962 domain-containing protein [Trinickia fusca]
MKTLTDQLTQYAAYHRDRRNIATHFVGIPMIVVAIAVLLSRPQSTVGVLPFAISPAWLLFIAANVFYFLLDASLALAMVALSIVSLALGSWLANASLGVWLVSGLTLFVVGWVFQFVGHVAYEHKKPAFADDIVGLLIGPLFIMAELLFALGWRPALREAVEQRVGPAHGSAPSAPEHQAR